MLFRHRFGPWGRTFRRRGVGSGPPPGGLARVIIRLMLDRQAVISKLREHEAELRAAGISSLALFGSVARGEAGALSDVDLMAEFDASRTFSLEMIGLENRLADILAGARGTCAGEDVEAVCPEQS